MHDAFTVNGVELNTTDTRTALFDAAYPFIFIPTNDFKSLTDHLNTELKKAIDAVIPGKLDKINICGPDVSFSRRSRCNIPISCSDLR